MTVQIDEELFYRLIDFFREYTDEFRSKEDQDKYDAEQILEELEDISISL